MNEIHVHLKYNKHIKIIKEGERMGTKYKTFRGNKSFRNLQSREAEHRRNLGRASSLLSNILRYSNGMGTDFFLIRDPCSETIQSVSQR